MQQDFPYSMTSVYRISQIAWFPTALFTSPAMEIFAKFANQTTYWISKAILADFAIFQTVKPAATVNAVFAYRDFSYLKAFVRPFKILYKTAWFKMTSVCSAIWTLFWAKEFVNLVLAQIALNATATIMVLATSVKLDIF